MTLKSLSVRNRIFLYFSTIMAVLTTLSGMMTYKLAKNILMEKTINQTSETIPQMSGIYNFYMKGMKDSLAWVCNSEVLQGELCNGVVSKDDDYTGYDSNIRIIERMIVRVHYSYGVDGIAVYSNEGNTFLVPLRETGIDMTPLELHETAKQGKEGPVIVNDSSREDNFLVVKQIKDSLTVEDLGVAIMGPRKDYLKNLTNNADFPSEGTIMLLDEKKESLFNGGRFDGADGLTGKMVGFSGYFPCETNGGQYVAICYQSDNTNWTTIGLVPMVVLMEQLAPLKVQAFLLMIVFLLISLAAAKTPANRMIHPVEDMSGALVKFVESDFSVRIAEYNENEMGKLGHISNGTTHQVEGLIDTVVENRNLGKELEFQTLQAQINPHFLYNTMDIINWMAYGHKEMEICDMVQSVNRLMRLSVNHKAGNLMLEQEIGYIRDYLYIRKVRYRERLEVLYRIHEEVNKQVIPKFTIQPLVKSSIVHGLEGSDGKCLVLISARRHGETVEILVRDTGGGIDDKHMRELRDPQEIKTSSSSPRTHIGLYAVDQGIKYLLGIQYGLTTQFRQGEGTAITIRMPFTDGKDLNLSYREVIRRRHEETQGNDIE